MRWNSIIHSEGILVYNYSDVMWKEAADIWKWWNTIKYFQCKYYGGSTPYFLHANRSNSRRRKTMIGLNRPTSKVSLVLRFVYHSHWKLPERVLYFEQQFQITFPEYLIRERIFKNIYHLNFPFLPYSRPFLYSGWHNSRNRLRTCFSYLRPSHECFIRSLPKLIIYFCMVRKIENQNSSIKV